jgi:hypothetical protein
MVKHPENEHVSENGGVGGEIGLKKGNKGGMERDSGLFSAQHVNKGESAEIGNLSVG